VNIVRKKHANKSRKFTKETGKTIRQHNGPRKQLNRMQQMKMMESEKMSSIYYIKEGK
jgi:hypothetical protein